MIGESSLSINTNFYIDIDCYNRTNSSKFGNFITSLKILYES